MRKPFRFHFKPRPRPFNKQENLDRKAAEVALQRAEARTVPRKRHKRPSGPQTHFEIAGIRHTLGQQCWCKPTPCPECECPVHSDECELCDHGTFNLLQHP